MKIQSLAHLSDLHIDDDPRSAAAAAAACRALVAEGVDRVILTGDVTHHGKRTELAAFEHAFEPLLSARRVTLVPGNHDRAGDDVGALLMPGPRVQVEEAAGLWIVRLDSTGPHNRSLLTCQGQVDHDDIEAVVQAVQAAPPRTLVLLALHHHLTPLPGDVFHEDLVSFLGWPWCDEIDRGEFLLARLRGHCDLVLHGHRHVPRESQAGTRERPLGVFNAGATGRQGRFRIFLHRAGELLAPPRWADVRHGDPRPASRSVRPWTAAA